ncbi:hypothetical protein [Synechococcus sp. W4D4]|uniref:hypothetical protein n=1 Tax=Synechococcus sp. W4D4 TaxID=3392294 RepID=UPI0039EBFA17
MAHPLVFLIAPLALLPEGETTWADLVSIQHQGPSTGFSLRLFTAGETSNEALADLPWDGQLDPGSGGSLRRLICDAEIPCFDPQGNAIGIYQRSSDPDALHCIDRFSLLEAVNETCWFYPTHDGRFLSWERDLTLTLEPGVVASEGASAVPKDYERSQLALLWSLLADDQSLTCVGLTYGGQRIEWGQLQGRPDSKANWRAFSVDTQAEVSLTVHARLQVLEA